MSIHSQDPTQELRRLEEVAERGESGETPFILLANVWLVCAVAFLVVLAISLLAYRLAS